MANQNTPKVAKVVSTTEDKVRLTEINVMESVQSRAKAFDEDAVARYMLAIEQGDKLPPIELFTWDAEDGHTDQPYFVGAGFNRLEAYRRLEKKEIPAVCSVVAGGRDAAYQAAQWCSITSNATHGLPRSQADRRRAIKLAIESQPHLSDSRIAKLVRVDNHTVAEVRAVLEGRPSPRKKTEPEAAPVENAERPDSDGDSLERVREAAQKAVDLTKPIPAKRVKELKPVLSAVDQARAMIMAASREVEDGDVEVAPVVEAIYRFLERCGEV